MSKTLFIEKKLREKGIYDAKDEDIAFLKAETIENIFIYKDLDKAFEEALQTWKRKKGGQT